MPTYRKLNLSSRVPALPGVGFVPLQPTAPAPVHDTIAGVDTLPQSGHRVIGEWGLRGGDSFLCPSGTDPFETVSRLYPDKDTPRVVFRAQGVALTPGHLVAVTVATIPSGPLQRYVVAFGWFTLDGAGGEVELEVTYRNGDADSWTSKATISLAPSELLWSSEPAAPHFAMTSTTATATISLLQPTAANWEKYLRGGDVVADITVTEVGFPRVVDGHVHEVPSMIVVDQADARWPTAMYSAGAEPYGQLPVDYPVQQLSATDPAGGTASLRRALYSHGRELGPLMWGWSSAAWHTQTLDEWISYDAGTGDDEAPAASTTGTTPTLLPFGSTTGGDLLPGWALAHYARQVDHGDHFLDGRTGVLPVWIAAYCRVSAGTGTFELRTDDVGWSIVKWTTTSTTWGWVVTPGWLEVGTGPEDAPAARLWAWNSGANDTQIRYLLCFQQVRG